MREFTPPIQLVYDHLRRGESLTEERCESIAERMDAYTEAQLGALAAQLALRPSRSDPEDRLVDRIARRSDAIRHHLQAISAGASGGDRLQRVLARTRAREELDDDDLADVLRGYQTGGISDVYMAIWLMTITYEGLSPRNTRTMTYVMRDSGNVFDYRRCAELGHRKITRRYPTGALSEKISLIMPTVIAALAERYPIASNYLVHKALSFTGGTWDKLAVIPGFTFPTQGPETLAVMQRCHAAMSVTNEGLNPLDRKIYQLRSVTGTVESIPLIVASVVSKHLAIPADYLLLDVRHGEGAFVRTQAEGQRLGDMMMEILREDMAADYTLTGTAQPSGMAVGHSLEVMEAIAILKDDQASPVWDRRALLEQRDLVSQMLARMLNALFPRSSALEYQREIEEAFGDGTVLAAYRRFLAAHGVAPSVVDGLIDDPASVLLGSYGRLEIPAPRSGIVRSIDQRALGVLVNFELKTGLNEYVEKRENGAGVILRVRLGDAVQVGQPLCTVVALPEYLASSGEHLVRYLGGLFAVEPA